jgi:hypothetical protein
MPLRGDYSSVTEQSTHEEARKMVPTHRTIVTAKLTEKVKQDIEADCRKRHESF